MGLINYNIGYLFQNFELIDNLNARENILLPIAIHNMMGKEDEKRIDELVKYLEIEDVMTKFPSEMSGGQKQRVAAARALILNPEIVLAALAIAQHPDVILGQCLGGLTGQDAIAFLAGVVFEAAPCGRNQFADDFPLAVQKPLLHHGQHQKENSQDKQQHRQHRRKENAERNPP